VATETTNGDARFRDVIMAKSYTRKDFFKAALSEARNTVGEFLSGYHDAAKVFEETAGRKAAVKRPPWVRPPGALAEKEFLEACTRCDDCIKACPPMVIRKAGAELGSIGETPIILPQENPCEMCDGWPCIAACEPGALRMPKPGVLVQIGMISVTEEACYLAQKQPCDYCQVHCPEKPKAILAETPGKPPRVRLDICTGCGKCAQICPANALHIEKCHA
jgi:ferredoxin-type protein NapG